MSARRKKIRVEGIDLSVDDVPRSHGIFLSYASQDRHVAKMVAKDLAVRGLDVWYDQWDSRVGRPVTSMLEKGVESKEWFIVLISEASLASKWVTLECEVARRFHDEYGLPKILPCVLDQCELPTWVSGTVYADFHKDYTSGFTQLLGSLTDADITHEYKALQQLDSSRSRAGALFRRGNYTESAKLYEECMTLFESARGEINLSLGQVAFNRCRFDEAFERFKRGYTILRRQGDLRGENHALQFLAHYLAMFGRKRQAMIYLNRLLKRTAGREIHTWNIMRRGMIELEYGNHKAARKTLDAALAIFEQSRNEFGISATKYLLARERICRGDDEAAIALLDEAMVYSRNADDPKGIAYTLLRQAQVRFRLGHLERGSAHLEELLSLLDLHPDANVVLEGKRILSELDLAAAASGTRADLEGLHRRFTSSGTAYPETRRLRQVLQVDDQSVLIEGM